eukprot:gene19293-948_t
MEDNMMLPDLDPASYHIRQQAHMMSQGTGTAAPTGATERRSSLRRSSLTRPEHNNPFKVPWEEE